MPAENKSATVRRVFDSVAERYDVMNDLMSLGLHRAWKAFALAIARPRPGERILDVATGSGDLALALCRRTQPGGEVWISDINRRMLERGRDRLLDAGLDGAGGAMRRRAPAVRPRLPSIASPSASACAT